MRVLNETVSSEREVGRILLLGESIEARRTRAERKAGRRAMRPWIGAGSATQGRYLGVNIRAEGTRVAEREITHEVMPRVSTGEVAGEPRSKRGHGGARAAAVAASLSWTSKVAASRGVKRRIRISVPDWQ